MSMTSWRSWGSEQHLENVRQKGLLPRLTNDRATCVLCRLFRLGLRRFCFLSVTTCTANECAMSWPDSTFIVPVTVYYQRSCVETYSRFIAVGSKRRKWADGGRDS